MLFRRLCLFKPAVPGLPAEGLASVGTIDTASQLPGNGQDWFAQAYKRLITPVNQFCAISGRLTAPANC